MMELLNNRVGPYLTSEEGRHQVTGFVLGMGFALGVQKIEKTVKRMFVLENFEKERLELNKELVNLKNKLIQQVEYTQNLTKSFEDEKLKIIQKEKIAAKKDKETALRWNHLKWACVLITSLYAQRKFF